MVPPCGSCQGVYASHWPAMVTHFSIGHSPDPDDAFMFYAMTESLIETGERRYDYACDIQTLNQQALDGEHDVSAVSIHSYR